MTQSELLRAAEILASHSGADDDELAGHLIADGLERSVAYRLVAFMPSAFARPLLERLGVSDFADRSSVVARDGSRIEFALSRQPEYVQALALARDHWKNGAMPPETYEKIALGSAEMDSVNAALNAGEDIEGATVAVALGCSSHAAHIVQG